MAVEVREIVIRAVLEERQSQPNASGKQPFHKAEMVRETVSQVLQVLKKKKRR